MYLLFIRNYNSTYFTYLFNGRDSLLQNVRVAGALRDYWKDTIIFVSAALVLLELINFLVEERIF